MPSLEDLSEAEQAKAMALYSFVQGNPDVAKTMRKLAREKNPTMPVPDTDTLEEKFNGEIEQLREQIKKRDEESLENLKTQRRSDAHDRIRAAGLDPEEVEKKMVEEHILPRGPLPGHNNVMKRGDVQQKAAVLFSRGGEKGRLEERIADAKKEASETAV